MQRQIKIEANAAPDDASERFGYGSLDLDYWINERASAYLLCTERFGVAQLFTRQE